MCLGLRSRGYQSRLHLGLPQETYIKKVLERFRMHNSKPIDTPINKGYALSLDHCHKNDEEKKEWLRFPIWVQLEV